MKPRRGAESPSWLPALNPFDWVGRAVGSYMPSSAPLISRRNYGRELLAGFFLPWTFAIVEGGVLGVIVKKYFGVLTEGPDPALSETMLNYAVAVVAAAPAFANVASFLFVRLAHGRHKVRSVNAMQIAVGLLVCSIALAPRSLLGLVLVIVAGVLARMCLAGMITLRSAIWRSNYTRAVRARLTGRIAAVQTLAAAGVGFGVGQAMQVAEWSFRLAVPVAVAGSIVGILAWSRVRVRRHRALLRAEHRAEAADRPSFNPVRLLKLFQKDKRYAAYQACQFTIGVGNMMCIAPIVILTEDVFEFGYRDAMLVTQVIPFLMIPLFVGFWSMLLDRWHIVRYRAVHTWVFVAQAGLFFLAAYYGIAWLMFAGAAVRGLAFSGGAIAWNLGHNDFASDENSSLYMAAHVTLTGVRGLIAPFVGVTIYNQLEAASPGGGAWLFAIAFAVISAGALFFVAYTVIADPQPQREDSPQSGVVKAGPHGATA